MAFGATTFMRRAGTKDVLNQCNTHMVFRVANVEDLSALAGSFEAASQPLPEAATRHRRSCSATLASGVEEHRANGSEKSSGAQMARDGQRLFDRVDVCAQISTRGQRAA